LRAREKVATGNAGRYHARGIHRRVFIFSPKVVP